MARSKAKRRPARSAPQANPAPSPRWVPVVGLGLIGLGIVVVILRYLIPALPASDWLFVGGFAFMAGGLAVLSQWR